VVSRVFFSVFFFCWSYSSRSFPIGEEMGPARYLWGLFLYVARPRRDHRYDATFLGDSKLFRTFCRSICVQAPTEGGVFLRRGKHHNCFAPRSFPLSTSHKTLPSALGRSVFCPIRPAFFGTRSGVFPEHSDSSPPLF